MDDAKVQEVIKKIQKKYGKDSIFILGENKEKSSVGRWETGIEDFDIMMEGGLPKSRVVEISGPEGAGKTSICLAFAARSEFTVFIDAEGTLDDNRASVMGVPEGKLIVERPDSGEEIAEAVVEFTKANVPLIIVDSVPAIVPHSFLEKLEKKGFESDNIAGTARILSQKLFPSLIPALKHSDSTIIFINQIRDKIGLIFGDPTDTPGGRALKHYAAVRIQVRRKQYYGLVKDRIGQLCAFRVVKSKVSTPYKECEIPLHFDKGFVSHEEIKQLSKDAKVDREDEESYDD